MDAAPTDATAPDVPEVKRINVAVNADMLTAITQVIEHENVSLTEAVRRLIAYGGFVHHNVRINGRELLVHDPTDGTTHRIQLLNPETP